MQCARDLPLFEVMSLLCCMAVHALQPQEVIETCGTVDRDVLCQLKVHCRPANMQHVCAASVYTTGIRDSVPNEGALDTLLNSSVPNRAIMGSPPSLGSMFTLALHGIYSHLNGLCLATTAVDRYGRSKLKRLVRERCC